MGWQAVVAVVSFSASQSASRKARKNSQQAAEASKNAELVAQKRADLRAQRERVQQVRQARIARGKVQNAASVGAGTGGSGSIGSQNSIQSQLGSNIGFLDKQQALSKDISNFNIAAGESRSRANNYTSKANSWSALSDLTGSFDV